MPADTTATTGMSTITTQGRVTRPGCGTCCGRIVRERRTVCSFKYPSGYLPFAFLAGYGLFRKIPSGVYEEMGMACAADVRAGEVRL
jgi:hypothetical protein